MLIASVGDARAAAQKGQARRPAPAEIPSKPEALSPAQRADWIARYRKQIDRTPRDATARRALGLLLLASGDTRIAIEELELAVRLAPERVDYRYELAHAYEQRGRLGSAGRIYLELLERGPDPIAAQRYDALGYDTLAHGYDYAPHRPEVDTFFPGERSGFAVSGGLGNQYAGFGVLQLDYRFLMRGGRFALAPYATVGVIGGFLDDERLLLGLSAGVMLMYGPMSRWVLDLGFGAAGTQGFALFGQIAAERAVYALNAQLGREFMFRSGVFIRALAGISLFVDPYIDEEWFPAISFGMGWKP